MHARNIWKATSMKFKMQLNVCDWTVECHMSCVNVNVDARVCLHKKNPQSKKANKAKMTMLEKWNVARFIHKRKVKSGFCQCNRLSLMLAYCPNVWYVSNLFSWFSFTKCEIQAYGVQFNASVRSIRTATLVFILQLSI